MTENTNRTDQSKEKNLLSQHRKNIMNAKLDRLRKFQLHKTETKGNMTQT